MPSIDLAYRVTVYDSDGSTVLTPRAGSVHSDEFKIATKAGVSGYQPYMGIPRGRVSNLRLLESKVETGQVSFEILDRKTGTGNAQRWATAFAGDDKGRPMPLGKKAVLEEWDGSTWSKVMTGKVKTAISTGATSAIW